MSSLRENVGGLDVTLTEEEIKELDGIVNNFKAVGERCVVDAHRIHVVRRLSLRCVQGILTLLETPSRMAKTQMATNDVSEISVPVVVDAK